jgi:hypothetical protein
MLGVVSSQFQVLSWRRLSKGFFNALATLACLSWGVFNSRMADEERCLSIRNFRTYDYIHKLIVISSRLHCYCTFAGLHCMYKRASKAHSQYLGQNTVNLLYLE